MYTVIQLRVGKWFFFCSFLSLVRVYYPSYTYFEVFIISSTRYSARMLRRCYRFPPEYKYYWKKRLRRWRKKKNKKKKKVKKGGKPRGNSREGRLHTCYIHPTFGWIFYVYNNDEEAAEKNLFYASLYRSYRCVYIILRKRSSWYLSMVQDS